MAGSKKTKDNLEIFHRAQEIFGPKEGKFTVQSYWDEKKENWVDIIQYPDSPYENVVSFSTIGLSDFSIGKKVNEIPLGVEILGASYQSFDMFPNIISTCAFNIIIDHYSCFPGCIYPHVVEIYAPKVDMKHILFVPPFGWEKEFHTLELSSKKVAWLLAIPISEAEYQYARQNGLTDLENRLEEKQVDTFDLKRKSVL